MRAKNGPIRDNERVVVSYWNVKGTNSRTADYPFSCGVSAQSLNLVRR